MVDLQRDYEYIEDKDEANIQQRVDQIVDVMFKTYEGREDRLIPVYDVHGNMWWPKKMSYEGVKKMVQDKNTDLVQQDSPSPENG